MQQLKLLCRCILNSVALCPQGHQVLLLEYVRCLFKFDFSFDMVFLFYHCIGLNWSGWCDQIVAITMYYI